MVSDFIFYLRDNYAYLRDVKTTNRRHQLSVILQILNLDYQLKTPRFTAKN